MTHHYPVFFAQGETAYDLIDECDNDLERLCKSLIDYVSHLDEMPDPVDGEPKSFSYRFIHDFKHHDQNYRLMYTTGYGGLLSLDLIIYEEEEEEEEEE